MRIFQISLTIVTVGICQLCDLPSAHCVSKSIELETEKRPNQTSCAMSCILCQQSAPKCRHHDISPNATFSPRLTICNYHFHNSYNLQVQFLQFLQRFFTIFTTFYNVYNVYIFFFYKFNNLLLPFLILIICNHCSPHFLLLKSIYQMLLQKKI